MKNYHGDFLGVCHSEREFPVSVRKYFRRYFCGVKRKNFSVTEDKFETDLRKAVKQLLPEGFKLQNRNRNDGFVNGRVALKVKTAKGRLITVYFTSLELSEVSWATHIILERDDEYFTDSSCVTNFLELANHLRLVDVLWYRKRELPSCLEKFIRPDLFGNGRHNLMCVHPLFSIEKTSHPEYDKTKEFCKAYQKALKEILPEGYTFKDFRVLPYYNALFSWDIIAPDNKVFRCRFDSPRHTGFESFSWLCEIYIHLDEFHAVSLLSLADAIKNFEEVQ